jgi:7-cyano-7-deazaguanine tRNA-ribosyltransferase
LSEVISAKELADEFGCRALISNAYLLRKNFGRTVVERGVHSFLGYDHVVFTDSGAYQVLVYGDIEATQPEIIAYEEAIDTDVAVILDIPTGGQANRDKAEYTVNKTLQRAKESIELRTRRDILWVGPVQGGNYLDLVELSARETAKLPFDIYALGSPTQIMEQYLFDYLAKMILAAKRNLPVDKPLHLFGAGHPLTIAFAVALGCDIFDSAAYAIYAREGKYMTAQGTQKLEQMRHFPCSCKVCSKYSQEEVTTFPAKRKIEFLARHNLAVCFEELKNTKQAICEGRLWELLEVRARSHPALLQAFKILRKHALHLEESSPMTHARGLLFFDSLSLSRPEVTRHSLRLKSWSPAPAKVLVLIPEPTSKPFNRSREVRRIQSILRSHSGDIGFCVYSAPFGVTPLELDEVYPLSQFEAVRSLDYETRTYVAEEVAQYLKSKRPCYKRVVLYAVGDLGEEVANRVEKTGQGSWLTTLRAGGDPWSEEQLKQLGEAVTDAILVSKDTS